MCASLQVVIIGSGLGGLSLAQSLRRAGIDFRIFERDEGPFQRPQGYRLHLDADGINAAREVLPDNLWKLFEATSQKTAPYTTILKNDLDVLKRIPTRDDHGDVWPHTGDEAIHANVDRAILRQILLSGIEDAIEYGKTLEHFESTSSGITAFFMDGSQAKGDVLVGADGIRSVVRSQRAPHALTVDAGITAIYGRLPVEAAERYAADEVLSDIFTIAFDSRKVFLGLGPVRFPVPPRIAAEALAPTVKVGDRDDYVVCIIGGRHEYFPCDLRGASEERLKRVAIETLQGWSEVGAAMVGTGDARSFFLVQMYTSVPCELDVPVNVTLLGDAIHAMTPTLGRGANLAMRDGALLGRWLKQSADGHVSLQGALVHYERELTAYGFAVVREAARIGQQRMAQSPLPD